MTTPLHIRKDDVFEFSDAQGDRLFTFRGMLGNGIYLLSSQETGGVIGISVLVFEYLLMKGKVVRLPVRLERPRRRLEW